MLVGKDQHPLELTKHFLELRGQKSGCLGWRTPSALATIKRKENDRAVPHMWSLPFCQYQKQEIFAKTRDTSQCAMKILPNGGPIFGCKALSHFFPASSPNLFPSSCFRLHGFWCMIASVFVSWNSQHPSTSKKRPETSMCTDLLSTWKCLEKPATSIFREKMSIFRDSRIYI